MKVPSRYPPRHIKLAVVGEAPGFEEAAQGVPFVGESGRLLDRMLMAAGTSRDEVALLNVFSERPPGNDLSYFFESVSGVIAKLKEEGSLTHKEAQSVVAGRLPPPEGLEEYFLFPRLGTLGFLKPQYVPDVVRMFGDLARVGCVPVIALGGTALWALTGHVGITSYRGTFLDCKSVPGLKVLATYHPAAVLREFKLRPTVIADLKKALGVLKSKARTVLIPETVQDVIAFFDSLPAEAVVASDVETEGGQITCISFSADPYKSMTIPFWNTMKGDLSYWSFDEELAIWELILRVMWDRRKTKVFQHAVYDLTYLREHGILVRGTVHDTMLMHHSLQPELPKGLGYLASLYCDAPPWKTLRVKAQHAVTKKEE